MEALARKVEDLNLLQTGDRICVAVSGGADSVLLLHLLHSLKSKYKLKLIAAHLNHKLRGRDSDKDQAFVKQLAKSLRVPFVTETIDVKGIALASGVSIEMAARQARHQFLAEAASRVNAKIALAHHAGDQVELFFLRLLRGSSMTGLAGMKPRSSSPFNKSVEIIRPILNCTKTEILQAAENLRFREDKTNADTSIPRNAIRHILIPFLTEQFQPNLDQVILRTMDLLATEDDLLQSLEGTHPALVRRNILRQLQDLGVKHDFADVETLRKSNKPVSVGGKVLRRQREFIEIVESPRHLDDELVVSLKGCSGSGQFAHGNFTWEIDHGEGERFDADRIGDTIRLRHWQPGDRFQPIGMGSAVKLQDIFTNQKIPPPKRRKLVLAENSHGEIFWVEGLRIGHVCRKTPQTRRLLFWKWIA